MKLTLTLFFILFAVTLSFGQKQNKNERFLSNYQFKDSTQFKVDYTRFCLEQFRKEKLLGYKVIGGSAVFFALVNYYYIEGRESADTKYYNDYRSTTDVYKQISARQRLTKTTNRLITTKDIGTGVAIVSAAGGIAIWINSYRWMKRAYIVPEQNGIGIGLKF